MPKSGQTAGHDERRGNDKRHESERFFDTVLATLGIDQSYHTNTFSEWQDFSLAAADLSTHSGQVASSCQRVRQVMHTSRPQRAHLATAEASGCLPQRPRTCCAWSIRGFWEPGLEMANPEMDHSPSGRATLPT